MKTRHGADRTLLDNQGMSALDHAQQVGRQFHCKNDIGMFRGSISSVLQYWSLMD